MILVFDGTLKELISDIALFAYKDFYIDKGEDKTVKFVAKTFNIYISTNIERLLTDDYCSMTCATEKERQKEEEDAAKTR